MVCHYESVKEPFTMTYIIYYRFSFLRKGCLIRTSRISWSSIKQYEVQRKDSAANKIRCIARL